MTRPLPLRVTRSQVKTALAILGIPVDTVVECTIGPRDVYVEQVRLDQHGHPFAAGPRIATVSARLAVIADPKPDPAVRRADVRGRIRAVRHRRPRA